MLKKVNLTPAFNNKIEEISMKCIKHGDEIRRVSDEQATEKVKNGWQYCPKSEWKTQVRDANKKPKKAAKKKAKKKAAKKAE